MLLTEVQGGSKFARCGNLIPTILSSLAECIAYGIFFRGRHGKLIFIPLVSHGLSFSCGLFYMLIFELLRPTSLRGVASAHTGPPQGGIRRPGRNTSTGAGSFRSPGASPSVRGKTVTGGLRSPGAPREDFKYSNMLKTIAAFKADCRRLSRHCIAEEDESIFYASSIPGCRMIFLLSRINCRLFKACLTFLPKIPRPLPELF